MGVVALAYEIFFFYFQTCAMDGSESDDKTSCTVVTDEDVFENHYRQSIF